MAALARGTCLVPARAMPGTSLFNEFRCHVTNFDWRRGWWVRGEREYGEGGYGEGGYGEGGYGAGSSERASEQAIISKMYIFINMVMTRVKNRSPDMILTAFEGKFDKKKDEIPPEVHRPHILEIFQY